MPETTWNLHLKLTSSFSRTLRPWEENCVQRRDGTGSAGTEERRGWFCWDREETGLVLILVNSGDLLTLT